MENISPETMRQGYAMYCRKSSESDDRQAESIPAQLEILRSLAKKNGLIVLKTYTESKSAKAPNREKFNEMMNSIEKHGAKGILCWKMNRLSRNPIDPGRLQWLLQEKKIEEIVTPNKIYTDFDSDLVMAVEGGMANKFIRDLREDTKRGIDRKIEKGWKPGLAPVGYQNDSFKKQGDKTISPHPLYFELVRKIFNLALTGNYSVLKLYENALEMNIKNNLGKPISRTQMYTLLTNPFYTGVFIYGGRTFDGAHLPMISLEEYEIIQGNLHQRSQPRGINHDWVMTGFIRCGICNRQITAEQHVKKNGKVHCYYKCTGKYRYGCTQAYVPQAKLEEAAYKYLGKIKLSSRFVEWAIKVLKRATDEERERHEDKFKYIQDEYNIIDQQIYNFKMKWATTKEIPDEMFFKEVAKLKAKRKQFKKSLNNKEGDFDQTTDITVATLKFAQLAQDRWQTEGIEYKKGILRIIGSDLILNNRGKLEIKPRTPFLVIERALKNEAKVQPTSKYQNARLNSVINPNAGSDVFRHPSMGG